MKISEFEASTQSELFDLMEGYKWRRTQEINDLMTLAWFTSRLVWVDKVTLESLLISDKPNMLNKPERPQTQEEMSHILSLLTAAFGGKVVEQE